MKKFRPSEDSGKKAKVNLVKERWQEKTSIM